MGDRWGRISVVALAAVLIAGCGNVGPPHGTRVTDRAGTAYQLVATASGAGPTTDPVDAARVATAEQGFALSLLGHLRDSGGTNPTISPFSLAVALAMLENGARGSTQASIAATLHTANLTPAAQNAGWATILTRFRAEAASSGFAWQSADSLWEQKGFAPARPFMDALQRYFTAGVWEVDFAGPPNAAVDAINAWVDRSTAGKIPTLYEPGQLDANTILVLANAVHFKADWATPFIESPTVPGPFHPEHASTVTANFMHDTIAEHAAIEAGYDVVELPYQGGQVVADLVMPTASSLRSFISAATPSSLEQILGGATGLGDIYVPRFTFRAQSDLMPTLSAMGMAQALGPSADYSALGSSNASVSSIVQADYLSVDENGTEAAAATGMSVATAGIGTTQPVPVIRFDHPFLFVIRDKTSGAILFASLVGNPVA